MEIIHKEQDWKVINWNKDIIDLREHDNLTQILPIELHIKEDGDINNQKSYALVCVNKLNNKKYVIQISHAMLMRGLKSLNKKNNILLFKKKEEKIDNIIA
jgi:hypothetical protein